MKEVLKEVLSESKVQTKVQTATWKRASRKQTGKRPGKGDDYGDVKSAIQIGIMDFILFRNSPEFYSTYMMINSTSGQVYTDKFRLQLLELKSIDLATDEDKKWG